MASDGDPTPANPDLAATTTTALDLTNEHLPTLDGVDLPEMLEVSWRESNGGEESRVLISFFYSLSSSHLSSLCSPLAPPP